jgi:UDPglucose 6-dehydrogenase
MYDLCQKLGIDYDLVKESARADARVGKWHLEIFTNLFTAAKKTRRGYDGKCLPKDTKNLIRYGDEIGIDLQLLKKVDAINESLKA